jgi:hypothetical protein
LIPIGSKDKVLTYEHNLEAHDPVFTKTHGLTAEHLAPEIRDINGKEFNFRVELIGKRFDQVIVKKGFNLKLTLDPEYKLEEIKPTSILTDVATPSESQAKRDYKIERLKEFIRDLESNQFVSLDREVRSRRLMLAWQVEEFLKEYFDEAHAKRYTKEGVSVLKKTLKDLLE